MARLDLVSAAQITASEIEIAYSALPLATGSGPKDALTPTNYTLTGPGVSRVVEVQEVLADLSRFRLIVAPPLKAGTWTVTVSNIKTVYRVALSTSTASFVSPGNKPVLTHRSTAQETGYHIISQCLSPAFQGGGWEPIKKAFGWSAQKDLDYGRWASDQLFLDSSSGRWLEKRSLENGLSRPALTGIEDPLFRKLGEAWVWGKLTGPGLWAMLDVFYGPDQTRAVAMAELPEPYALSGGEELWLEVRDGSVMKLVVDGDILSTPGAASALSVASALNYQLDLLGVAAYADTVETEGGVFLRLVSRAVGPKAKLVFWGGSAQRALRFPTRIHAHDGTLPTWTIATVPLDAAVTFTCSDPTGTDLSLVYPGDYVLVSGSEFLPANRGTFEVLDVQITGTLGSRTQVLKVAHRTGAAQVGIAQLAEASLLFFRPNPVVQDSSGPTLSQARGRLDIELPVGSRVVGRDVSTAGYLHDWTFLSATAERVNSTSTVTTSTTHGLQVGQMVELTQPTLDYTPIATTAGSSGTSDSSPLSIWSDLDAMSSARSEHAAVQLQSGDVLVAGGWNGSAYVATCDRFRVTSDIEATDGRRTIGYSWVSTAVLPDGIGRHTFTQVPYLGAPILAGGWQGAVALDTAYLYDEVVNTWTTLPTFSQARYWHAAAVVGPKLYIVGGNDGSSVIQSTQVYDTATGAWTAGPIITIGRERHAVAAYEVGGTPFLLMAGGIDPSGEPTAECEVHDTTSGAIEWVRAGDMGWARYGHHLIRLADQRVLAVGGIGRPACDPSATLALISAVEVFDPVQRSWSPAGDLVEGVGLGVAALVGETVFTGMGGAAQTMRRLSDGRFVRSAAVPDISPSWVAFAGTDWVLACGGTLSGSPTAEARLLIPNRELYAGPSLPEFAWVATVPSLTSFTIEQPGIEFNVSAWSSLSVGARPYVGDWLGPYLFSPASGLVATEGETTLTQDIEAGHQYLELQVSAALDESVEWIAVDFGGALESGPVRYLGPASATSMRVDYDFVWPSDVPSGTSLTALAQTGPYSPKPQEHVAYLAPSDSAVVAAKRIVEDATAAGLERRILVRYTADRGMGAEGYPSAGEGKLSDLPVVWSGE